MFNKVGKATRFGKDMYWWYNTGKKLYDKGKDIWDEYFYKTMPHHQFDDILSPGKWKEKIYDFGANSVTMDFYVC